MQGITVLVRKEKTAMVPPHGALERALSELTHTLGLILKQAKGFSRLGQEIRPSPLQGGG